MMRASIVPALLLLGGCISLLPEPPPPPRVFVLEAADVATRADAPRVDAVIAVSAPTGERSILGTDLVWRTGDELAYVSQTQWSTRAEFALQSMLVETLKGGAITKFAGMFSTLKSTRAQWRRGS
jgi:ABC-type uncharacterized transport system auxiliary subunit